MQVLVQKISGKLCMVESACMVHKLLQELTDLVQTLANAPAGPEKSLSVNHSNRTQAVQIGNQLPGFVLL